MSMAIAHVCSSEPRFDTSCSLLETAISSESFSDGEGASSENTSVDNAVDCHASLHYGMASWRQRVFEEVRADPTRAASDLCEQQSTAKTNHKKNRPVCLDYVNGTCHLLRSSCRYYHPELNPVSKEGSPEKMEVCEVWLHTGRCKFGEKCWKQHPSRTMAAAAQILQPLVKKCEPVEATLPMRSLYRGGPLPCGSISKPVDQNMRNSIALFERLKLNPEKALEFFSQDGLSIRAMLPLLHAMTVKNSFTGLAYVNFIVLLRHTLPTAAGKRQVDQMFFDTIKCSMSRTLEMDTSKSRIAIVLRARGVRNVHVLTEALSHALVGQEQVAEIVSLLTADLETQSAEHQDLRVLLLSHLLGAVFHSYGPASADCHYVERFVHSGRTQWDTEIAWQKLLQLRQTYGTATRPKELSVRC